MTVEQVTALFGQPANQRGNSAGPYSLFYRAPTNWLRIEHEGYVGFEVYIVNGKVVGWRILQGNPSYETPNAKELWRSLKLPGIILLCMLIYKVVKQYKGAVSENDELVEAYRERLIASLPVEFRFINNDTTLGEVVQKVGPYSRAIPFPVDPGRAGGFGYIKGPNDMPSILRFEYDLPYHAVVILLPEYPFEPQSRVRAAYYRTARMDEDV